MFSIIYSVYTHQQNVKFSDIMMYIQFMQNFQWEV